MNTLSREDRASALCASMARRRSRLAFRLTVAIAMSAFYFSPVGSLYISVWALAYLLAQAGESTIFSPARLSSGTLVGVRFHLALASIFINTFTFGSLALVAVVTTGATGVGLAGFLLAGVILNTAQISEECTDAFRAGAAASLLQALIIPLLAMQKGLALTSAMGLGGAAIMLLVSAAAICRDTARKSLALRNALAIAEDANLAKSNFLAIMSHEIRTPLNGVLGMAQAMAADELSKTQRERLEVVRQSGQGLLAILNDILDISKIEAGKLELERINFQLSGLLVGCHSAFTPIAERKGLSFNLEIDPRARGVYLGDPTRVRQICYNLISNAIKFTDHGEVRVEVTPSPDGIRIRVSDTGIGMSKEDAAKLFHKFVQADASTTRRFGGTGLGLSIVQELTTALGGRLAVESAPAVGSIFTVELPMPRLSDETEERPSQVQTTAAQAVSIGGLRVLIAEDNTVNQLVVKTILHQAGLHPVVVSNGALAVEAWENDEWDIILMDIQMPEMDGLTATQTIRDTEQKRGRRRTPIIALTANAMAHQVAEYRAAGMDGYVAKPIEAAKLYEALDAVMPYEEPQPGAADSGTQVAA